MSGTQRSRRRRVRTPGRHLLAPLLLSGILVFSSCETDTLGPEPFLTTGTIEFLESAGCWAIVAGSHTLEPLSIPEAYRHDGARIRFEGVIRRELSGSCDIGPVVEIHWVIQLPQRD